MKKILIYYLYKNNFETKKKLTTLEHSNDDDNDDDGILMKRWRKQKILKTKITPQNAGPHKTKQKTQTPVFNLNSNITTTTKKSQNFEIHKIRKKKKK